MAKKKSKVSALEVLLDTSIDHRWVIVDTNNNFTYQDGNFIINESVKQYVVLNKPKKINDVWNDWTNEASMTTILCVDTSDELRFFDENLIEVNGDSVKIGR